MFIYARCRQWTWRTRLFSENISYMFREKYLPFLLSNDVALPTTLEKMKFQLLLRRQASRDVALGMTQRSFRYNVT